MGRVGVGSSVVIIRRYIAKEIAMVFFTILLVLTVALLSQQFVRYLNFVALGKAPANAVLSLVGFEIPRMAVFLLPLSIYLSLLWVYSRLQIDHEMLILEMSGFGFKRFLGLALMAGFSTAICVFVLMFWINPWVSVQRQQLLGDESNVARLIQTLIPGRFHISGDDKRVIYVESLSRDRTTVGNIFMAESARDQDQTNTERWNVVVAKSGSQQNVINESGGYFVLQDGYRYEGLPGQQEYKILKFAKYAIQAPENNLQYVQNNREALMFTQLLQHIHDVKYNSELQWRLAMPILTIVLAILALSLCYFSPRQSQFKYLIPAILIFIVYVNLILLSKRWVQDGQLSPYLGIWWVHGVFLLLALYLIRQNYYRRG